MATERRGSQAGRTERWCDTSGAESCCLEEDSSERSCSQASRIAKTCRDTNDVHGAKDSIEQVRDPINCEMSCWARRSMVWLTGNQPRGSARRPGSRFSLRRVNCSRTSIWRRSLSDTGRCSLRPLCSRLPSAQCGTASSLCDRSTGNIHASVTPSQSDRPRLVLPTLLDLHT